MSTELAKSEPQSVREFLALPAYKNRFEEIMRDRAPQFMASLIQLSNDENLAQCDPKTVIASAVVAATLDFPLEKALGQAFIIPYGRVAQFQMAARGYIQLAMRTSQYQRMNAVAINAEAFDGYDDFGEPKINWDKFDEELPAVGYFFGFRLTNGFAKTAYWSKGKIDQHAKKFSKAYANGRKDSPWFTNFDQMALKTVVMNTLRKWGVLSVQMQKALTHDQGVQTDVDAEIKYVDNDEAPTGVATPEPPPVTRPPPKPRSPKGVSAVAENPKPAAPAAGKVVDGDFTEVSKTQEPASASDLVHRGPPASTEPPKTADTPAAPASPPPSGIAPRTSLKDGEKLEAVCTVKDLFPMYLTINKEKKPSIKANVTGGFEGSVNHFGGGIERAAEIFAPDGSPWKVGATVKLHLRGVVFLVGGPAKAMVDAITLAEPASEELS